ncbi:SSI family serine proteinase inhibitor [Streptomyces sp. Je 1-369]|uniref:SSI family serine proteinase inhibitor n=1 Tax=Streptomyces sp. Je 1-369 TaxID=2966192 RepID=UPI002286943E|nr:SSI family serine proteinase inhibitor [Streptomyces sp. Je 1-369]WAL93460.1 subtilase-type protease inhibitor [Streptomyces sp. Je 1-369]
MRSFPLAAAAALVALGGLAPAQAAETAAPATKRGLFLTVSGAENTWTRGVLLRCVPEPAGAHPQAARACEAVAAAGGDFDGLPDDPHACTKEFDPVTATATGSYKGKAVKWHKTYPNACALDADTGHVFRF